MPPTPRAFQSACCAACICAMSADFIRTTCRALKLAGASPALPVARTRSPTAMSVNWLGFAVFRSVLPTASCTTFAPLAHVDRHRLAGVGGQRNCVAGNRLHRAELGCACRRRRSNRRRGCLGLGRGCKAVAPARERKTPRQNAILSETDLFPVAICILLLLKPASENASPDKALEPRTLDPRSIGKQSWAYLGIRACYAKVSQKRNIPTFPQAPLKRS